MQTPPTYFFVLTIADCYFLDKAFLPFLLSNDEQEIARWAMRERKMHTDQGATHAARNLRCWDKTVVNRKDGM